MVQQWRWSHDTKTGNHTAAPATPRTAVLNICRWLAELQDVQNACNWYIHQSCPDNPRRCHAFYIFLRVLYFFQPSYQEQDSPQPKSPRYKMSSLTRGQSHPSPPSDSHFRLPTNALEGFCSPASPLSTSCPTGRHHISEVRPLAWRWSSGRSRSAGRGGAASGSGNHVHVCGGSAGFLPAWRMKWCCSGHAGHLLAWDSLSPWSVHLGENRKGT